jgi:hypothetical protein
MSPELKIRATETVYGKASMLSANQPEYER